jgi:type I site-specific restriction-modification system R (restriction) subunit
MALRQIPMNMQDWEIRLNRFIAAIDREVLQDVGTYWAGRMHGGKPGDRRAGVVWHTQGSGKSFSMLFYAARVVRHAAMQNPTLVVLTDRNDLDDQLFGQFQRCHDILGQMPVQADGREDLRALLNRASGGVVFTTIHKFMPEKNMAMPELSARQNIVVIADEAHRSQYGFGGKVNEKTGEMSYGFASNLRDALPNASFIGFTGTPIEKTDANTRAVFGDYISIYDIQRAVADQATVPIYYESRISKLSLNAAELPKLDAEFEEITEGEELTKKEKLKTKWAALEALVGDPKRIALVAADLVAHFEKRVEAMDGKAMIVCMSRRICVVETDAYRACFHGATTDDEYRVDAQLFPLEIFIPFAKPLQPLATLSRDDESASWSAHASRTHPRSQRCAGSASNRGCQSIETVNSGTETGSGKLCIPARRFPVCRSGTLAIRSEARARPSAVEKPPTTTTISR